jgi:hypothetical protein
VLKSTCTRQLIFFFSLFVWFVGLLCISHDPQPSVRVATEGGACFYF